MGANPTLFWVGASGYVCDMTELKKIISRRAVFAQINQDITEDGRVRMFSLKYCKQDGTVGFKARCSKSFRSLPGPGKFRTNVKKNYVLLIHDHDANNTRTLNIDTLIEYNGYVIDHRK